MVLIHDYNLDKVIVEYHTQQRAQASSPHRARTLWELHTMGSDTSNDYQDRKFLQIASLSYATHSYQYNTPFQYLAGLFLKVMIIYIGKHIFVGYNLHKYQDLQVEPVKMSNNCLGALILGAQIFKEQHKNDSSIPAISIFVSSSSEHFLTLRYSSNLNIGYL